MVKVIIYSSKDIYDNATFEGRAEADIIAYRVDDHFLQLVKNKITTIFVPFTDKNDLAKYGKHFTQTVKSHIKSIEREEWKNS